MFALSGLDDEVQQSVAGRVPRGVVDLLETVDVDEGERELAARPPGALDLAGHLGQPEPSRPGARQLVGGGELESVARFLARETRLGALRRCLLPVVRRPRTVVGCLRPIGRCSRAVAFGTQENVVPTRVGFVLGVAQMSQAIAGLGAAIAKLGRAITILRNLQPRRRRLVARV